MVYDLYALLCEIEMKALIVWYAMLCFLYGVIFEQNRLVSEFASKNIYI